MLHEQLVPGRRQAAGGAEVALAAGGAVRDQPHDRAEDRAEHQAVDGQPQQCRPGLGEEADEQAEEQPEPADGGSACQGRSAAGEPPGDLLDQAQVRTHDRQALDREPGVRQVVDRGLRLLVLGVGPEGVAADGQGAWGAGCRHALPLTRPQRTCPHSTAWNSLTR